MFPGDLGGHKHDGPASVWQLREFQVLECGHDARRGAGFSLPARPRRNEAPSGHSDYSRSVLFAFLHGMAKVRL